MYQSIQKYRFSPITITKFKSEDRSLEPVLLVCQPGFYNYTKSSSFGYKWMVNLWSGTISDVEKKVTWKGNHGNLSFDVMSKELYTHDYSTTNVWNGKLNRSHRSLNMGICKQLSDVQYRSIISSDREFSLVAVDPFTQNDIRINTDVNLAVTVGPADNGLFDSVDVTVEHSINDFSILEGVDCRDYKRIDSSYGHCVYESLQVLIELNGYIQGGLSLR